MQQPMRDTIRTALPLGLAGFAVLFSYELSRSSVESMFLSVHGDAGVPWAWLLVAPCVLITVLLYNRWIVTVRLTHGFVVACALSAAALVALLLARRAEVPGVYYGLYVWKDVYIVVLVEMFWTLANQRFPIRTAKWLYGGFLIGGSLGAISAGLVVGPVAQTWGTAAALALVVPTLVVAAIAATQVPPGPDAVAKPGLAELGASLRVVRTSSTIGWLVLLIAVVQVTINLIDFTYQQHLHAAFADEDARTAFHGQVNAAINALAIVFQLGAGWLISRMGVGGTLRTIPVVLAATLASGALIPGIAAVTATKVMAKSMDYSLFRAAKELLYIPMTAEEQTQGKAVVDMLTYRVAKAGAASLVLLLSARQVGVTPVAFLLTAVWLAIVWKITAQFRREHGVA